MNHIYQHFKKDERLFIDKIIEKKQFVEDTYIPYVTPFLTPREQLIVDTLFSKKDSVQPYFYGGFKDSQRKKACLAIGQPSSNDDFDLVAFNIRYPKKFATLKHSQILGSLLGLGIHKEHIGDIITDGIHWHIIVSKKIAPYIEQQLHKIGAISVVLEPIQFVDLLNPLNQEQIVYETVSSLRLDTMIAKSFSISRQKAQELIAQGFVTLNWKEETRTTVDVSQKDTLSIRRHGRVVLDAIIGTTKHGKFKIKLKLLKNHCK